MNILIVEDSISARAMMRFSFEQHDCTVIEAKDGQEGLEMAALHKPDVIISDALMPRLDGYQLLHALKEDPELRSIPFIFHSSTYTGQKDAELALSLGAEAFIPKPVGPEQLWEKTSTVMQEWEARQRQPAHPEIRESNEQYLREYSGIVASKLEEKVQELEEALERMKQAEEELRRINTGLEQRVANEVEKNREKDRIMAYQARLAAMGEMLSNISHQWRQPLNNVALTVQNLQADYECGDLDPGTCRSYVKLCMKELTYLSRTIDTFRHFYEPEQVSQRFALYPAVADAILLVRDDLEAHGIRLETINRLDSYVNGYQHEFSQVILSVISNAREAILLQQPADPLITIVCAHQGDAALVTIRDNGGGIPAEVMDKIFDPYFTTKFMSQGKGLGLYMSKMIIEKHLGGVISVSNRNGGVEVAIQLPRAAE